METVKIYTFSIIRVATEDFADKVPYCTGIIEYPNGERKAAFIDGYKDGMNVSIGQEVQFLGKLENGLLSVSFV